MSLFANVVRQSTDVWGCGYGAFFAVFAITAGGEAMGVRVCLAGSCPGLFVAPWVFLTVFVYIPLALIDDKRG